jgi:hypothetical protein
MLDLTVFHENNQENVFLSDLTVIHENNQDNVFLSV